MIIVVTSMMAISISCIITVIATTITIDIVTIAIVIIIVWHFIMVNPRRGAGRRSRPSGGRGPAAWWLPCQYPSYYIINY